MFESIGTLLGGAAFIWLLFALVVGFVFAGVMPFMAYKAMRAIVGIHRELETVNVNLDEAVRLMRELAPPETDRLARRFHAEQRARDAGAAVIR